MPPRGNKKPTSLGKRPQRAASPELPQPHKTPRRRSPSPRTLPFTEQETQYTGNVGAAAFSRQEPGFSDYNESGLSHAISGLETPTDLQRTNDDSREAVDGGEEGSDDSPIRFDFSWVDFSRTELRGYRKPLQEANLHNAVWHHGVPLEVRDVSIAQRWWLCKRCFLAGSVRIYKVKDSLGAVKRHLHQYHRGALKNPKEDWRENVISWLQKIKLDPANPHHQEAIEKLLTEFNPKEFHASIRRWFICSRIPFQRIEDSRFLQTYVTLHPLVKSRKVAPCRKTLRRQIMHDLQIHKDEIRRRLSNAAGKVHLAVDIWTARNNKAFNGIVAYWVKEDVVEASELLADWDNHGLIEIGSIDILSSPTDDEESESCREDDDDQENDSAHGSGPGIDTNDTQLHHAYFGR